MGKNNEESVKTNNGVLVSAYFKNYNSLNSNELKILISVITACIEHQKIITSNDIAEFFNFAPRTARKLAQDWVEVGFLVIVDNSKKARKYQLQQELEQKLYQ